MGKEKLMAETRQRAARINRYMDMIPAKFYLGTESLQVQKARSLDPERVKSTSQLVVEAAEAEEAAKNKKNPKEGDKAKNKNKKGKEGHKQGHKPGADVNSRTDLQTKLHDRIAQLREDRKQKQSAADKAKAAAKQKEGKLDKGSNEKEAANKTTSKAKRAEPNAVGDDLEAGSLNFEPRKSQVPFGADVGLRGAKIKELRKQLRQHDKESAKISRAETEGKGKEIRNELAMQKALKRARGEKVHDDITKLRKSQKRMEGKKKKGKEQWESRAQNLKDQASDRQAKRKENLMAHRSQKKMKKMPEAET